MRHSQNYLFVMLLAYFPAVAQNHIGVPHTPPTAPVKSVGDMRWEWREIQSAIPRHCFRTKMGLMGLILLNTIGVR